MSYRFYPESDEMITPKAIAVEADKKYLFIPALKLRTQGETC
jgi:hypothetical protein